MISDSDSCRIAETKLRTRQPKIDPRGSPPYAGGILRHARRTLGRAPRRWVVLGRARRAFENGLESRTPIHCKVRFSKRNVAAGSGRLTQIAPPSVPAMHAPEAILTFGPVGRQEARVRTAFSFFRSFSSPSTLKTVWFGIFVLKSIRKMGPHRGATYEWRSICVIVSIDWTLIEYKYAVSTN